MDFVEWCDVVLIKLIEVSRKSQTSRGIGIDERFLASHVFDVDILNQPSFQESTYFRAMSNALSRLQQQGLVERSPYWKVTRGGRAHADDTIPLWEAICQEPLEDESRQVLQAINFLSVYTTSDHAWLGQVSREMLVAQLGSPDDIHFLIPVAEELIEWGYITGQIFMGGHMQLSVTYRGLVWESRRGLTLETKFIDDLVAEWETTSVDFKQYLYIKTVEQKAEFIKDVLSLANTKASGRRWMIIGFNNKTHDYCCPPNSVLNQDDFERLIDEYTNPHVDVRYVVAEYRKGLVGKLEVLRDHQKLPYRVAKSLGDKLKGDKKQIFKGQIFVRHGSQVVVARGAERKALLEEGKQIHRNP